LKHLPLHVRKAEENMEVASVSVLTRASSNPSHWPMGSVQIHHIGVRVSAYE
jgi:hypothetical protein